MPLQHPQLPPPPKPTKIFFDPFNSSSTGHQTAPNTLSGSTSWRESRTHKLSHQLSDGSGRGGSSHLSDLVGAGSENYQKDGRKPNGDWERDAPGLREKGWQDIRKLMKGCRKRSRSASNDVEANTFRLQDDKRCKADGHDERFLFKKGQDQPFEASDGSTLIDRFLDDPELVSSEQENTTATSATSTPPQPPQIFRGLTIYLNGSTAPLVSDHRLKQLLATHGGNTSLALGRRTVTHVILGDASVNAGGGLAAGKIQKEITTTRGKSLKFVTAQWVIDSVEKGIRQPEGQYQPSTLSGRIGGYGQKSVVSLFAVPQK